MTYTHTFSAGSVDLILATILLLHGYFLELVGDVVGGSAVDVPVRVDAVGAIGSRNDFLFILRVVVVLLIPVPLILCCVPDLAADLAPRGVRTVPAAAPSTASATSSATRLGWRSASFVAAGPALVARGTTRSGAAAPPASGHVGGIFEAAAAGPLEVSHALIEVG